MQGKIVPPLTRTTDFLAYYAGGLLQRFAEHHVLFLAGGLAFSVFLCIIPLILVVFALLGILLEASSIRQHVGSLLDNAIPYPEYSTWAKGVIFSRVDEIVKHRKAAGLVGGLGLLLTASGLFSSMRTILHLIFGIGGDKTVFLKKLGNFLLSKLRDLGMVFLVLAFFLVSTFLLPTLEIVANLSRKAKFIAFVDSGLFETVSSSFTSIPVFFLLFFMMYYLVPVRNIGSRTAAISAFWAAVLWEIAKQAFGYYTPTLASRGKIFGAYLVLVVIAIWISWSAVVFITGAEIGRLSRDRGDEEAARNMQ
jgi:membrane protein